MLVFSASASGLEKLNHGVQGVVCISETHFYHSAIAQRKMPTERGSQQGGKGLKVGTNRLGRIEFRLINYKSTCGNKCTITCIMCIVRIHM